MGSEASARHRRCVVVRGTPSETREAALTLTRRLDPARVLWVGEDAPDTPPSEVAERLGQAFDAVVLELHRGLHADVLGLCHGFVWGGGALILRMPPLGEVPLGPSSLVVPPHEQSALGGRMWAHLERCLARAPLAGALPLEPVVHQVTGTEDQRRAVEQLVSVLSSPEPGLAVLLSDRGRGKSSALGLAIRALLDGPSALAPEDIVLTAAARPMAAEIVAHAGRPLRFVPPAELASRTLPVRIVLVDEAAALPVPLLRQVVERHPEARFAMASTVRGYEGTGRGFVLRFLAWARARPWKVTELSLQQPIRWADGDPLEEIVFDILLLGAEPRSPVANTSRSRATPALVDRDALVRDEASLRDLFGLLVHAHYRTTPQDLHRLLDSPNLVVHCSREESGRIVGATLLAREGELPADLCRGISGGAHRIRGHALPETLMVHSGHPRAGRLRMLRSVRIAAHPEERRRGIARELVEHVHRHHAPEVDLFGTLFGVTPELLRFRRSLGYELVRLGASRGARSGEPTAVMLRPISPEAVALMQTLRAELARDLPLQLQLMALDGEMVLDPELVDGLVQDLPEPAPLPPEEQRRILAGYAHGPRPYDVVATAVTAYVEANAGALGALAPADARIIALRVLGRVPWRELADRCGLRTVPAAMRALRRAIAALVARVEVDPSVVLGDSPGA